MQPSIARLAKPYKVFLFLLPLLCLPLEIEWFETPKQYLVTLVALVTLPVLFINRKDLKIVLEARVTTLLFTLFFVLTLTSIANGYFGYSLVGSPFRRDGLVGMWSLFSIYLGFSLLFKYQFEAYLVESVKSSALVVSILGIIQFLLGYATIWNGDYFFDGRITSTLGQPNFLTACLLASLPFFIRKERYHVIGLGTILLCLTLTFSRLNILLIILATFIFILTNKNKAVKYLGVVFLVTGIISTTLFFTTVKTDELYYKIQLNPKLYQLQRNLFFLSKEQLYGEKRFAMYASGAQTFVKRPLIGYGKAVIEPALRDIKNNYNVLQPLTIDSTHNLFLDIAIEGGVIALITSLLLVGLTLRSLCAVENKAYLFAMLLLLVCSQFFIISIVGLVYLALLVSYSRGTQII